MTSKVRVEVSVCVRGYEGGVVIAQSLQAPYLAAAERDEARALAKLREALVVSLERLHPTQLAGVAAESLLGASASQRQLELFCLAPPTLYDPLGMLEEQSASQQSALEELSVPNTSSSPQLLLKAPLDVVFAEAGSGLIKALSPAFGVVAYGDTASQAERRLARRLRSASSSTLLHRPPSSLFSLAAITVEVEALDLRDVPLDELWREQFPAQLLAQRAEGEARPRTPTLEQVAERWSHLSDEELEERGFEPCFARQARARELVELLESTPPTPVVVVGIDRVGKTSLIKHLATMRSRGELGRRGARALWFASSPRLCATDAMSQGWQMQCRELFGELEVADEILYIGRLIEALDAGKFVGSDYNLAQFIKPLLADNRVRVVAEATPSEWSTIEQRDIGFARTFHVLRLEELPEDIAYSEVVVPGALRRAEREGLELDPEAIKRAWTLQQRFSKQGSAAGRTLDFLSGVLRRAVSAYQPRVDDLDLVRAFCEATGLPQFMLLDERTLDLNRVIAELERRVMGQREAVRRVADVIGITKAGLAPPDRPLGSFLFVGPTGVGKTELAKSLALFLFGDDSRLVRLDMSEYSHPNAYGRLIGDRATRHGLDEEADFGGDLTGPVRRQPFCVVLLDEIEKAHSSVFDLLLQVLGEARLTDVHGRTTRFQNTIVIMTSNLGVSSLKPSIGFGAPSDDEAQVEWERHFRREAERFFRPEFLARINQIIPFEPLSQEVTRHIARRELELLLEREGLTRLDVSFSYDEAVEAWVAERGLSAKYGARPLKRLIDRAIAAPLAAHLAEAPPQLDPEQTRHVSLEVDAAGELRWRVEVLAARESIAAARRELLEQIHQIAELRRKLQHYTYTEMYIDLEWEISSFTTTSIGAQFWQHPGAAQSAARADRARRIVEPAEAIAQELAALEDLAHEAYYGRSFELAEDLSERLSELRPQLRHIFLVILRSVFERPDHTVLFLPASRPQDLIWRDTLIGWYARLAEAFDFSITAYRSRPSGQIAASEEAALTETPQLAYEPIGFEGASSFSSQARVVALAFEGFAARPLLLGERGLQRLIDTEGSAQVEVAGGEEDAPWLLPEQVLRGRSSPSVARIWNRRTREVSVPYYASAPLDERDPWRELLATIEEVAWMIVESQWAH